MVKFRPNVDAMAPYVPGEQPAPGTKVIKLNTNENPYPPSPTVVAAIQAEMGASGERLRLYSDPKALALRQAAAETSGFSVDEVLHGNGSDELLAMLCRAFIGEGDTIALPYPTYVLYETLAHAQAARIETVDFNRDFELPEALFKTKAKIIFLASPNSPSGTVYTAEQIKRLASALPDSLIVIDEAYAEFADSNNLALARSVENVVVLRTFSKSHSLAGMRLGLLFANKGIIEGLWKVKDSYNLDRLAIVAGAAALRDQAWTAENTRRVRATRQRLVAELTKLGLSVVPSQANFLFARMKDTTSAAGAYKFLKERGILIRYFSARLLDDGIRVTVGADAEIDAFLAALKEYLARG
jgi:histidinol-phosphate aminotransferase